MLSYMFNSPEVIARWVADHIPGCQRGFTNCRAIGVFNEDGEIIAGLVYHNWEPEAGIIEISAAAVPRTYWMTRQTLQHMYGYPFDQLHCQMVVQRVRASDERQLRMLAVYGFALHKIARLYGRDEDGVVATLTYEDWRNNKFNRRHDKIAA